MGLLARSLSDWPGDGIRPRLPPTLRGHWLFWALSVTTRVSSSGDSTLAKLLTCARAGEAVAGVPMRFQCACTAAALNGFPSLNFTLGRSFTVQVTPSGDVTPCEMPGDKLPSDP